MVEETETMSETHHRSRAATTGDLPSPHASFTSVQSASSISSSRSFNSKRQAEFEKYFAVRLNTIPGSSVEVLATQSCDLQANLLLHGRLYLTTSHLCFRSNILGYLTEKLHPLEDITAVEKGTTAKWIENAVYVSVLEGEDEPDGTQYGYGSLADRNALFTTLSEAWRLRAPQRYDEMHREQDEAVKWAQSSSGSTEEEALENGPVELKPSKESGENFLELALDRSFPISLDRLFQLLYHDLGFLKDFLADDRKLTDIDISDWSSGDHPSRTLTHTMHIGGIGPSTSRCLGRETLAVSQPQSSYEIVSETQTPDVPSGKKFKICTRTCLTKAILDGRPGVRMHCTTECQWSSSSWLQKTITPAVIKGQQQYHEQLGAKIEEWARVHPHETAAPPAPQVQDDKQQRRPDVPKLGMGAQRRAHNGEVSLYDHALAIPHNPVMLAVIGFLLSIIMLQWLTLSDECD